MGLAVHHSFVAYAAVVSDVEVKSEGELIIHSADIAFDCGLKVNPEHIRSQMEGSIIMGIGIALQNEINAHEGQIEQDNFYQFLLPRIENTQEVIRVHLVNSSEAEFVHALGYEVVACDPLAVMADIVRVQRGMQRHAL